MALQEATTTQIAAARQLGKAEATAEECTSQVSVMKVDYYAAALEASINRHRVRSLEWGVCQLGFSLWSSRLHEAWRPESDDSASGQTITRRQTQLGTTLGRLALTVRLRAPANQSPAMWKRWTRWRGLCSARAQRAIRSSAASALRRRRVRALLGVGIHRWKLVADSLLWQRQSRQMMKATLAQVDCCVRAVAL